jgi:hypothetical protein
MLINSLFFILGKLNTLKHESASTLYGRILCANQYAA